jgi:hypothetical protein
VPPDREDSVLPLRQPGNLPQMNTGSMGIAGIDLSSINPDVMSWLDAKFVLVCHDACIASPFANDTRFGSEWMVWVGFG